MKKIVLVEDDITLADMYKLKLELDGHECIVAYDGATGLNTIKEQDPDMVLLDLMLPKVSGGEILQRMRESDWGKDTKVIIMTNVGESGPSEQLKKYHYERYLIKANHTLNQVGDIIREILEAPVTAKAA